jgi:hypothetical protein
MLKNRLERKREGKTKSKRGERGKGENDEKKGMVFVIRKIEKKGR